jgi:hypothetical protein
MHSGTTLLHNILAANPVVFSAADETRYFAYLPLFRRLYPDLTDDETLADLIVMLVDLIQNGNPDRMRSAPKRYRPASSELGDEDISHLISQMPKRGHDAVFGVVFDDLTRRAGRKRWLEKTPQHVFLIDEILFNIPDACFVEIVRDPRDILASKKKRRQMVRTDRSEQTSEAQRIKAIERVYDPFWDTMEWRLALRAGQQFSQKYPKQFFSIRYEDLVAHPEATVQAICDFLGLTFAPNMLDVRWWNTAEGEKSQQKGITSQAIGRWAQVLTPGELALCQGIGGTQFKRMNYALAPVHFSARIQAVWLIIRAGFGLIDRLWRRWQLGGFPFLMNTLTNYGKEARRFLARRESRHE